jgi:hypothetical protein
MPNEVNDEGSHRTRIGEVLSRWIGGGPHAPSSDDVADRIVDAIRDLSPRALSSAINGLTAAVVAAPPLPPLPEEVEGVPVQDVAQILERLDVLGDKLEIAREAGEGRAFYLGRVLDAVTVVDEPKVREGASYSRVETEVLSFEESGSTSRVRLRAENRSGVIDHVELKGFGPLVGAIASAFKATIYQAPERLAGDQREGGAAGFGFKHEIARAMGYAGIQVTADELCTEIAATREALRTGLAIEPGPGLADGMTRLSTGMNEVRGALLQALSAKGGEFHGTTLVSLAKLVRDRVTDTRARSLAWHDAYRLARAVGSDLLGFSGRLADLSVIAARLVALDDQTTGLAAQ